jgi:predicted permease
MPQGIGRASGGMIAPGWRRRYRRAMDGTILSILMLAGIALVAGGLYLLVARRDRKRGGLMLVAALVMFANVAILALPVKAPLEAPLRE